MSEGITDPPTPPGQKPSHETRFLSLIERGDDMEVDGSLCLDWDEVTAVCWASEEIDALRSKSADLSLALAREAQLRQQAERERDQARAELAAIATVCGLAGVGSRGMSDLDRVKALSLELGHQIGRGDRAERERDKLIESQIKAITVGQFYRLPGNTAYQTKCFGPQPASFWDTHEQAVAAVRKAAGLDTRAPGDCA